MGFSLAIMRDRPFNNLAIHVEDCVFSCVYRASFKHEGAWEIRIRAGLGSAGIPAGYLNTTKKNFSYPGSHKDSG